MLMERFHHSVTLDQKHFKQHELNIDRRVSVVCKLSNSLNWHYIISRSNPADILSRRRLVSELTYLALWI